VETEISSPCMCSITFLRVVDFVGPLTMNGDQNPALGQTSLVSFCFIFRNFGTRNAT